MLDKTGFLVQPTTHDDDDGARIVMLKISGLLNIVFHLVYNAHYKCEHFNGGMALVKKNASPLPIICPVLITKSDKFTPADLFISRPFPPPTHPSNRPSRWAYYFGRDLPRMAFCPRIHWLHPARNIAKKRLEHFETGELQNITRSRIHLDMYQHWNMKPAHNLAWTWSIFTDYW